MKETLTGNRNGQNCSKYKELQSQLLESLRGEADWDQSGQGCNDFFRFKQNLHFRPWRDFQRRSDAHESTSAVAEAADGAQSPQRQRPQVRQ
jgi:hypothetical protein